MKLSDIDLFRFQQSGFCFLYCSASFFASCEKPFLSSFFIFFHFSPNSTLIALLSLPGYCCVYSTLYFLANNMKAFIGLFAFTWEFLLLYSADFFLLEGTVNLGYDLDNSSKELNFFLVLAIWLRAKTACESSGVKRRLVRLWTAFLVNVASGWCGGKHTSLISRLVHCRP